MLIAEAGDDLINNQRIVIGLDFIFAKGRLSVKMKAEPPEINVQGILNIRDGRHPLIDPQKVVPISVPIGKDYNTLVITGPNTGGKTVTLKTVGLFVLMAQSGLHLPAAHGTNVPVFQKVFADIGMNKALNRAYPLFLPI